MKPVDIAHSKSRNALLVTWDDDVVSTLPVDYLRGWCPCAGCQGHGVVVEYKPASADVTVDGLFELGSYALGIRFSDGHDAGIYTWEWLRKISAEAEPKGLKNGRFELGAYHPKVSS